MADPQFIQRDCLVGRTEISANGHAVLPVVDTSGSVLSTTGPEAPIEMRMFVHLPGAPSALGPTFV
jgi:hypothetical protein